MFLLNFWNWLLSLYMMHEPYIRIGASLGIILLAWVFRQFLVKVILNVLRRFTSKTKTDLDDQLLSVVARPVKFIVVVIAVSVAVKILPFSSVIAVKVDLFMDKMTRSLILFALFWSVYAGADVLASFVWHIMKKSGNTMNDMVFTFIGSSIKVAALIFGIITVVQVWITNIGGILTGLGLGGLAFALAAQETAANLFGSITIMVDKPFSIGDWISTPDVEGTVEEIGFRSTRIRTFTQAVITVPNSALSKAAVTNWSRMGKRRINFRLGVAYHTTNAQLTECVGRLRTILESHPGIDQEVINVYFERFGDNSLDILFYFFTKTTVWKEYLAVQEEINFKIMEVFADLKVELASPSRIIYLEKMDQKV